MILLSFVGLKYVCTAALQQKSGANREWNKAALLGHAAPESAYRIFGAWPFSMLLSMSRGSNVCGHEPAINLYLGKSV
jgi:hypothetical protein